MTIPCHTYMEKDEGEETLLNATAGVTQTEIEKIGILRGIAITKGTQKGKMPLWVPLFSMAFLQNEWGGDIS